MLCVYLLIQHVYVSGLRWWSSGKKSTCQGRDIVFDPWSENIAHASEQLGEDNGTHSSALAWKIPRTEEPGGLQSMGSLRVGDD